MKFSTRFQLSLMMFMEFFIWGGWFVTMNSYLTSLGASPSQIGLAYGTQALGAIIAPFIIGLIADRFFAAQKIMGVIHVICAGLMYYVSTQPDFGSFYPIILIYMILYMPTLALVNAIAFKQMNSPEKQFSFIRVFGTIGWIIAGWVIWWFAWKDIQLANTFKMTAIVSLLLGIFSFFLPNTPPPKKGTKTSVGEILGLDAIKLLKDRNFAVFFFSSLLICIPLAFYYQNAENFIKTSLDINNAAFQMTLGQISETVFILTIPFFLKRFGIKNVMLFSMIAWVLRFGLFAYGDPSGLGVTLIIVSCIVYGMAFDFFNISGSLFVETTTDASIRSSAQGLFMMMTNGVGAYLGSKISGWVNEKYFTGIDADGKFHSDWHGIWLTYSIYALVVAILFAFMFRHKHEPEKLGTVSH